MLYMYYCRYSHTPVIGKLLLLLLDDINAENLIAHGAVIVLLINIHV